MFTNKNRFKPSESSLNVKDLFLSGVNVKLDDWKETLLLDEKPITVPGNNNFVLLPSEIGLQPPNYFVSYPYTGESLFEEYNASDYLVTGWSVSLGKSGVGPVHYTGLIGDPTALAMVPLTGVLYSRSLNNPGQRVTIAPFYINSGENFRFGNLPETRISGNSILGWSIFSGLSGAEDLSVVLHGRYHDLYEENISQGIVMSSGDAAVSFFLEYGAVTGNGVLEYYASNEFIATRWGLYASTPGTYPLSPDPLAPKYPLSGRFYWRDPKSSQKTTITTFSLESGALANWNTLPKDYYVPFRRMIGIDIFYGLNDLRNLHLILGGKSIASANYFKNVVTKNIFDIFSGDIENRFGEFSTGTVGDYAAFTTSITNSNNIFSGFVTGQLNDFSGYMTGTLASFSGYMTGTLDDQNEFMSGFSGRMDDNYSYLSGYLTGLVSAGVAGVSSLNATYGAVNLLGLSGIKVNGGYPSQDVTIEYTSGNFNSVNFSSNPDSNIPYQDGRLYYSANTKSLNVYLNDPNILLNIGRDSYIRIANITNSTIPIGTPIYISGISNEIPNGWPANANNKYHIKHLAGLAAQNILNNQDGFVITKGLINGINTASFISGNVLFLGENGGIVNSIPDPNTSSDIQIGYVVTSAANGKILVDIGNKNEPDHVTVKDVSLNAYSFTKSDIGKMVAFSGNMPTQTGILETGRGFVPGDYISMINFGTGELYISSGQGCRIVSRESAFKAVGQYSVLEALCKAENFWIIYGDIISE